MGENHTDGTTSPGQMFSGVGVGVGEGPLEAVKQEDRLSRPQHSQYRSSIH